LNTYADLPSEWVTQGWYYLEQEDQQDPTCSEWVAQTNYSPDLNGRYWERRCTNSGTGSYTRVNKQYREVPPPDVCEELTHEDGNPEGILCGVCAPGYILPPGIYSPDSGSPFSTGYECMRNREPNECQYLDKFEVVTEDGAFCVDQCAGIGDDGFCIDEVEKDPDEPQCGPDHPEFKGVAGYGGEAVLICGDPQNNCPTDYTWGVVQK